MLSRGTLSRAIDEAANKIFELGLKSFAAALYDKFGGKAGYKKMARAFHKYHDSGALSLEEAQGSRKITAEEAELIRACFDIAREHIGVIEQWPTVPIAKRDEISAQVRKEMWVKYPRR